MQTEINEEMHTVREERAMIEKIQIIPNDFKESFENMPLESAGRVILALFRFANEEDESEVLGDDIIAKAVFPTIKSHVERHEAYRVAMVNNGKRGGAPIGNSNAKKTTENNLKQPKTTKNNQKQAPNPNPNPIPNPYKESIVEILSYLNERAGTKYGDSKESVKHITARLNEGFTVDDFKKVIDKKVNEWKGTEQAQYIRPSTLFAPSHFEEYLNAPEKGKTSSLAGQNSTNIVNRFKQRDDYDFEAIERKLIRN